MNIIPFTRLFYGVPFSFYYQRWQHEEGDTNIESFSSISENDPLGGPLFALAHYRTFLKTIMQTTSCVFPTLTNDIHIMGLLNKIIPTFDHLLTRLTLVGLKVKMLKFKLWNSSRIFLGIKIL